MNIKKPKFWDYKQPNLTAYLLYPLAILIKMMGYILNKTKKHKFKIKTICIGNLYIGGTGSHKTGQSAYVLDASGPILSTGNLRVIRRAPWDTGIGTSAGVTDAYPWYEVRIANHMDNFITATITG